MLAWAFHRISGVAIWAFVLLHVLDIWLVSANPSLYDEVLKFYASPVGRVGETLLGAALLYHALNGLRIIVMDFWPATTVFHKQLWYVSWVVFVVVGLPGAYIILRPDLGGSVVMSVYTRSGRARPQQSGFELAVWYLMRLSGLALFVLALGHFSITHFIFDPATQTAQWIIDDRWGSVLWRTVDWLLLTMVVFHCLHGRPDGGPGLHPGRGANRAHDAALPGRDRALPDGDDRGHDPPVPGQVGRPPNANRPRRAGHRRRRRRTLGGARARPGRCLHGRADQALPDPLPHRRRPGGRVRRPGEPGGGPLGVAHVRHRQGRRLPRRPGRGRSARPRGDRDGDRARAHGPAVQPDARREDRPAALRRPHPELRGGSCQAGLLRGRPDRPHDPPDPLPELHQGGRQVLRRVPRRRPHLRGRRWRRRWPGGRRGRLPDRRRRAPHVRGQGRPARHRWQRPDVPDHLECPLADRRRDGPRLPPRDPARGHGVLPVPSHGHLRDRDPPLRGGPRRGRHAPQRGRRALHEPLRAEG